MAFQVQSVYQKARIGCLTTDHGCVITPTFMPVATRAWMNHLTTQDLKHSGTQMILGGNTYHMLVSPGMEAIRAMGGMHRMMHWDGPMLTDSGGYQVYSFSIQHACRIREEGVVFRHPYTGQRIHMTPESSIQAQKTIGADIMMAFDHCSPMDMHHHQAQEALELTLRWLRRCVHQHQLQPKAEAGHRQMLFGIVQGGVFMDLRLKSLEQTLESEIDGIALGGSSIGFDMSMTQGILDALVPHIPKHYPRYTMGLGSRPQDLIDAIFSGADLFDCVAPLRHARHGLLYSGHWVDTSDWFRFEGEDENGHVVIKKSKHAYDTKPIMQQCLCPTCQQYTRGYLHYLFKQRSSLYAHLACVHNVHVMQKTCEYARKCIEKRASL